MDLLDLQQVWVREELFRCPLCFDSSLFHDDYLVSQIDEINRVRH